MPCSRRLEWNDMINDQQYYDELKRELSVKEARAMFLLQEIQYLKTILAQVESGQTRAEIKAAIEHNPFDDFDAFGLKKSAKR